MYDIIIVGAGPAGISAGLYAKRTDKKVLILYYGESNLEKATDIENYYGFIDGIDGETLYNNGIEQAKKIGADVVKEQVLNIEKDNNVFFVKTDGNLYKSRALILATGNKHLKPNIKGIQEFEGRGVSYCAICDGFFFKNKSVVVIGNGKFAINEAKELKNIVNDVKILTNGLEFNDETDVKVNTQRIKEIHGSETVNSIEFEDGSTLKVDGIFVALGEAGAIDFAKKMGIAVNGEDIIVSENMETNIDGLYSCGNATGGLLQVCKAVYEGAKAGLMASKYVNNIE